MSPFTDRLLLAAADRAVRVARRRVLRSASLRWAVRVPLVTLACCLLVTALAGSAGGGRRGSRDAPSRR